MGYPMAFPMPTRPAKVLFLYTFLRKDDENEKESNYINPCCSHYSSSILAGMGLHTATERWQHLG